MAGAHPLRCGTLRLLAVSRFGLHAIGALFYATAGFVGNTEWPQMLAATIWSPLVFLFLLLSLRGRTPVKSAAWAGVALGARWLGGHHGPSILLTLAVVGVLLASLFRRVDVRSVLPRSIVLFVFFGLVAAVQLLPTSEYGKLALRWTETGALKWDQPVEFPEHANSGLKPLDLVQTILPGNSVHFDPFVGVIGFSTAILTVRLAFGRREVRLFLFVAIAALLYSMAKFDVLYGVLYAIVPLVEKARSPIMALCIFHFAVTALVAFGANVLFARPQAAQAAGIQKPLLWFAGVTFAVLYLLFFFRQNLTRGVEGDPRAGMIAIVAVLLAGLFQAWRLGHLRSQWVAVLLGLLLIVEQGNEVGYGWAQQHDESRNHWVRQLEENRDVALFLRRRPNPKRVEMNRKNLEINFGDWYRIETVQAYDASMLTQTMRLNGGRIAFRRCTASITR